MKVFVEGVGLLAPGLQSWTAAIPVLAGAEAYTPTPLILPPSALLPANERRRTVATVKLALHVALEAFQNAKRDPRETATVFTSSGGDGETINAILEALASAELDVSPTRFHNSVHNAPSGYWTIATQTHETTTSLCAYDESFSAGLLDAAVQATVEHRAIGLVAYDLPYPEPLNAHRPIGSAFGVALILSPAPTAASFACLAIDLAHDDRLCSTMENPGLEGLRSGNPAARSLPLLSAIAVRDAVAVSLDHVFGGFLVVSVTPVP